VNDLTYDNVTAIDVLLRPDEGTLLRAKALNATLRRGVPSGFAFDETHQAHVTVLQRYLRSNALDRALEAVAQAISAHDRDLAALRLSARGVVGAEFGTPAGTLLASIDLAPVPVLPAFQAALILALRPFTEWGGTAAAFLTLPGEPPVGHATVAYVERFVPANTGERYSAHLSVGVGKREDVEGLAVAPFAAFEASVDAVAVYRLGDLGTARRALKIWPLGSSARSTAA
jgi:hypothetical protein